VLEALGAPQPLYGHLPLLHGPDGRKLSKRHGAASVQELRDAGYLPEAVRNHLALLGWGSGDDATVMSTEELVQRFALERVSRNPARFDETKLRWLNGVDIRELPVPELAERLERFMRGTAGADAAVGDRERFERAVAISQEKIQTLADFWPLAGFLFERRDVDRSELGRRDRERLLDADGRGRLGRTRAALEQVESFDEQGVQEALEAVQRRLGAKPREIYQPLRLAIAGSPISPGIFESVALLGREETLRRIDGALAATA
jgi:glutamyl/glutaminyl-tRNA synthetase